MGRIYFLNLLRRFSWQLKDRIEIGEKFCQVFALVGEIFCMNFSLSALLGGCQRTTARKTSAISTPKNPSKKRIIA